MGLRVVGNDDLRDVMTFRNNFKHIEVLLGSFMIEKGGGATGWIYLFTAKLENHL